MIKTNIYTPRENRYHLGDLINIVQQCHWTNSFLCGEQVCKCCGNSVKETIKSILELIKTNTRYIEGSCSTTEIAPVWSVDFPDHQRVPYLKSHIPSNTQNYIACQFDARSNAKKVPDTDEIHSFLNNHTNLKDVGESSGLNLIEKFHVVNNAKAYVGIDSGITHLCLMTDTPIFLACPKGETDHRLLFYPENSQIEAVDCLRTLRIS